MRERGPKTLKTASDAELMTGVRARREAAFDELYRRYNREVYAYCLAILRDKDLTSDIFQTTFMTVVQKAEQFKNDGNFKGWLFRIARNYCLKAKRQKATFCDLELADTLAADSEPGEDDSRSPAALLAALHQLADDYREPLHLHYFGGHSYEEVADIMNISLSLVKVRIYRAKKKLKSILTSHPPEGAYDA